jgi:hypothetical protein
MSRLNDLKAWWQHAFALGERGEWEAEDRELVERLAGLVVRRRLSGVALMVLEAGRPLNFLGSQVLVLLAPFATLVFSPAEYERFARLLERRQGIDLLIGEIEKRESEWHE